MNILVIVLGVLAILPWSLGLVVYFIVKKHLDKRGF